MKVAEQNGLEARLTRHFREVLSIGIDPRPWREEGSLPAYLRESYVFLAAKILGTQCLFLVDRDAQQNTPAAIRKHIFEVQKKWDGEMVYVAAGIDSARRKQLIDQKVPFVVPGNQIYLPMLGIDLREHFRSVRRSAELLSPAAQTTFLYVLYHGEKGALSPQEMAAALSYSSMSMSRAFDELESAGLGRHSSAGKRRLMELAGRPREQWEKALPLLRSPVSQRLPVPKDHVNGPTAGLAALAYYTNLAEPPLPVIAVASAVWRPIRNKLMHGQLGVTDSPLVEVEVWSYPPRAIVDGPVVDRLSLYLSLRGTSDERVEAALGEVLEGMKW
jgi:DNA-binding MarR family transcriptional regulator